MRNKKQRDVVPVINSDREFSVYITYEVLPLKITDPQFSRLCSLTDSYEEDPFSIDPEVDRFSKAWEKLAEL